MQFHYGWNPIFVFIIFLWVVLGSYIKSRTELHFVTVSHFHGIEIAITCLQDSRESVGMQIMGDWLVLEMLENLRGENAMKSTPF